MANRNKTRLYITLQYRLNGGFHWALLLAHKILTKDLNHPDSYYMHATNAMTGNLRHLATERRQAPSWRFAHDETNALKSSTLVGKVLVAKLGGDETLLQHAEYMVRLFGTILAPDKVLENTWNCISFVGEALALLQSGGKYGKVPQLTDELITKIEEFGQKEFRIHQKTAVLNPDATLDIRGD